uniref:Uncharacterized protein n=1 Tax=Anguilla anguilla TaxID=7936 RepID=A0A0E9VKM4_ANGAN
MTGYFNTCIISSCFSVCKPKYCASC